MVPAERTYASKRGWYRPVTIHSLPAVRSHNATVRLPDKPRAVTLQSEGVPLEEWTYRDGRVQLQVPAFGAHRMIVFEIDR
jgi:hypothetical protein